MPTLPEALETLSLLPDWESRYGYVLELAKALPPFPEADKTAAHFVPGCTAQVWEIHHWEEGKLVLNLASDAHIVQGLLALIWLAYNGKTAPEIAALNLPALLEPTQLMAHLSPNRRSGFAAVVARIQALGA